MFNVKLKFLYLVIISSTFTYLLLFSVIVTNIQQCAINYTNASEDLSSLDTQLLTESFQEFRKESVQPFEDSVENTDILEDFSKSPPLRQQCKIPKLDPFDPSIAFLIEEPEPIDCTENYPVLFQSTLNSTLLSVGFRKGPAALGWNVWDSCCYQILTRGNSKDGPDENYELSEECFPLPMEHYAETIIRPSHEFIVISCKLIDEASSKETETVLDMHSFPREKPEVESRIEDYFRKEENKKALDNAYEKDNSLPRKDSVNVVIFGIDAVSRMNFIRTFPETYNFVMNNLSAIEMQGFNKVGDNTYPNVAAVLTGHNKSTLEATCVENTTHDKCPFIWKEYAAQGYRTVFGEDSIWMGMFNYFQTGFLKPPTDYYLRPFAVGAESLIGTYKPSNSILCYGPRLSFDVLLDYMRKLANLMGNDKRYFQFIWSTALTHDYLNYGKLGDKQLLSTLQWFKYEGHLENTVFILMSDHGIRWGEIHEYLQGQLESRLPFLYYIFPDWFKERYSQAVENLKANRERLTTPFDIHETLKDLLHLDKLETVSLIERTNALSKLERRKNSQFPRGISQFLPIPLSRTCRVAEIEEHFCTCHSLREVGDRKSEVESKQAAYYMIYRINQIISGHPGCAFLTLNHIMTAHVIENDTIEGQEQDYAAEEVGLVGYHITVMTRPGYGLFEASVFKDDHGAWSIPGTITRNNLYGNQSHCISAKELKLYCYCIGDDF